MSAGSEELSWSESTAATAVLTEEDLVVMGNGGGAKPLELKEKKELQLQLQFAETGRATALALWL